MEKNAQYKRIVLFFEAIIILALQTGAFLFVWYEYYSRVIPLPYWRRGNWAVVGLYAIVLLFFSRMYGAFKVGYLKVTDVLYSQILSLLCVNFITYFQICLIGRWFMNPAPMLWLTLADVAIIIIWVITTRFIYIKLYPPRRMILIHGDREPDALIEKMNARRDKYKICHAIHIEEGTEAIQAAILDYEAVIICDVPSQIRNRILKFCFVKSKRVYMTPKISDIIIRGSDSIHLFDTPLLLSRNQGLTAEQRVIKRAADIIISVLGIVVASPFMMIIAILIKAYDGGPVFYRQERVTKDGERFQIYKFRSMITESEKSGARLAKKNDERVTPIGKVLRNIHFDELPQLFNILQGHMSIVGPRPEREEIISEYEEEIPEFRFRLKVKAGLTGYAQVFGKYNTTPYDKLKLDLYYIENYSIWLDLKLMFMTFKILFQKENTEGVDDWQITALTKESDK